MHIVSTKEGKATIFHSKGDLKKSDAVFFNPEMKLNRDLSVLALKAYRQSMWRNVRVADCLAATGARSVRYSKEVDGIEEILVNDLNPTAVAIIQKNIEANDCQNVSVTQKDANVLLSEEKGKIDYADLDPFGSPIDFLDSAARALSTTSFLGVTATDTAPLSGTYPTACYRKYFAKPFRKETNHEIGLRILVGVILRECATYEKAFSPVLCYSHIHYFRIFGHVKKRRSDTDKQMKKTGYFWYCNNCRSRGFLESFGPVLNIQRAKELTCESCDSEKIDVAGPLYTGKLFDAEFLERMVSHAEDEKTRKFLSIVLEESKVDGLPYDLHALSINRKTDDVVKELQSKGFAAAKTHYAGHIIRTNARRLSLG